MCVENVTIDRRKEVLRLIHETALVLNKSFVCYEDKRKELTLAVNAWVRDLALKHQQYPCKICGHTL